MPVYQARPPSLYWHQEIGWSRPIAPVPGAYDDSSSVASTCTLPRGLVRKLYHSSNRSQDFGRWLVDGWVSSATVTVAVCWSGWPAKYAPTSSPYQPHEYSVSLAA